MSMSVVSLLAQLETELLGQIGNILTWYYLVNDVHAKMVIFHKSFIKS